MMGVGILVLVGGYWLARALRSPSDRFRGRLRYGAVGWLFGCVLILTLAAVVARAGPTPALVWLTITIAWTAVLYRWAPSAPEPAPPVRSSNRWPPRLPRYEATAEEDALWRRAIARHQPKQLTGKIEDVSPHFGDVTPPARQAESHRRAARPLRQTVRSAAWIRLHCRKCGSALTRPMCESDPSGGSSGGDFRYGDVVPFGMVEVLPGDALDSLFFAREQLAEAAIPLRWDTRTEGCCGPEARGGPNVLCHGCGAWALFYNETCYSPSFFAARPTEVEVREVDAAEAHRRVDAAERTREHWARVALDLPGVISWRELVGELAREAAPPATAAGVRLEVQLPQATDVARLDRAAVLEAARPLVEHAIEVSGGGVELRGCVTGTEARIWLLSGAPVRADALENIPSAAQDLARELAGEITTWCFPDGGLRFMLAIPVSPIPLKPLSRGDSG